MSSTFGPSKSELYLLVIHCLGAMIQELIYIWSIHPIHLLYTLGGHSDRNSEMFKHCLVSYQLLFYLNLSSGLCVQVTLNTFLQ